MTESLPWLAPNKLEFPDVSTAWKDPNGLLAVGGDLSPERLIRAYSQGIFPWYEEDQPILWWSPEPRMLLIPEHIHISRSLAKYLRKQPFRITLDTTFDQVIHACSLPRREGGGTWITDEMKNAYIALHHRQVAHSLEVWDDDKLVGGVYGVAIGKAFFGESMFSKVDNASKVALVYLAGQLKKWGFGFIDCQMETDHLARMGAAPVARAQFQALLMNYTGVSMARAPWTLDWSYPETNLSSS